MRDLRQVLHDAAPTPRGPLDIDRAIRRGRILAWQRRVAVALVSLVGCVAFWLVATSLSLGGEAKDLSPADQGKGTSSPAPSALSCSEQGQVREVGVANVIVVTDAPGSLVSIASGEHDGEEWSLCAYTKTVKKNNQPPENHLCQEAKLGPGPYSGYRCSNLGSTVPSPDYLPGAAGVLKEEDSSLYYGVVSGRVQRVVIKPRGGTETEAAIFEPVERLGVAYKFFVGFAPPKVDVTVSMEGASGRELGEEFWNGGL